MHMRGRGGEGPRFNPPTDADLDLLDSWDEDLLPPRAGGWGQPARVEAVDWRPPAVVSAETRRAARLEALATRLETFAGVNLSPAAAASGLLEPLCWLFESIAADRPRHAASYVAARIVRVLETAADRPAPFAVDWVLRAFSTPATAEGGRRHLWPSDLLEAVEGGYGRQGDPRGAPRRRAAAPRDGTPAAFHASFLETVMRATNSDAVYASSYAAPPRYARWDEHARWASKLWIHIILGVLARHGRTARAEHIIRCGDSAGGGFDVYASVDPSLVGFPSIASCFTTYITHNHPLAFAGFVRGIMRQRFNVTAASIACDKFVVSWLTPSTVYAANGWTIALRPATSRDPTTGANCFCLLAERYPPPLRAA